MNYPFHWLPHRILIFSLLTSLIQLFSHILLDRRRAIPLYKIPMSNVVNHYLPEFILCLTTSGIYRYRINCVPATNQLAFQFFHVSVPTMDGLFVLPGATPHLCLDLISSHLYLSSAPPIVPLSPESQFLLLCWFASISLQAHCNFFHLEH